MRRGELYRVRHPGGADPRKSRVFVIVARQALIDSAKLSELNRSLAVALDLRREDAGD